MIIANKTETEKTKRTNDFKDKFLNIVHSYNETKQPPNPPDKYSTFIESERQKRIEEDKQTIVNEYLSKFNALTIDIDGWIQIYDNKINELRFPSLKKAMYTVDEIQYETYKAIEFNSALNVANSIKAGDYKIFSLLDNAWKSGKKHFVSNLIDALLMNLPEFVKIEGHGIFVDELNSTEGLDLQKYYDELNSYRLYQKLDAEIFELYTEKINLEFLKWQVSILIDVLNRSGFVYRLITQFDRIDNLPDSFLQSEHVKLVDTFNQYYKHKNKNLWSE
jgi:hypothetical protein